jgi:hypothetical protein
VNREPGTFGLRAKQALEFLIFPIFELSSKASIQQRIGCKTPPRSRRPHSDNGGATDFHSQKSTTLSDCFTDPIMVYTT